MTLRAVSRWLGLAAFLYAPLLLVAATNEGLKEASKFYQQGQLAQALERVDAVLATTPQDVSARFLKGVILTAQNHHAEAIQMFTALTRDYPELPEPHNNLAVLYAAQGQYQNARTELELAIGNNPDYAIAHENLGDLYVQLATHEYERASTLDRNNTSAGPKLKLIKQIIVGRERKTPSSAELQAQPLLKP
jgi:tetratricopeptide (TPR) repeat protein